MSVKKFILNGLVPTEKSLPFYKKGDFRQQTKKIIFGKVRFKEISGVKPKKGDIKSWFRQ